MRNNFVERIRKMQETESALLRRELSISRSSVKCILAINKLEQIARTKKIPSSDRKRLRDIEKENEQLRNLIKIEEEAITKLKQDNIKLQEDYQLNTEKLLHEERNCTGIREKLHLLQHLCNIHINAKLLPEIVQGMVVCGQEQENNWIPFRFATNEVSVQEIRDSLWNMTQQNSNDKKWQDLICGTKEISE